jgi:hypothetical protein
MENPMKNRIVLALPMFLIVTVLNSCSKHAPENIFGQIESPNSPQPHSEILVVSDSVADPRENSIPVTDMNPDSQTFRFKFPDPSPLRVAVKPGSEFSAGCDFGTVTRAYFYVKDGVETPLVLNTPFEKTQGDAEIKLVLTGLSKCMGYGGSFLVMKSESTTD